MAYEALLNSLGDYAKDIRLNVKSVLDVSKQNYLTANQIAAIALACAYATKNIKVIQAIDDYAKDTISTNEVQAAKAAAAIMGMNNIYYRFIHLVSKQDYKTMPAGLRMNILANPGVAKEDFELYSLAVSAINGCGLCIDSHVQVLEKANIDSYAIQHAIKIAAVIHALAQSVITD
ncbi:carboxymuconolactone decarboxylase family protein [Thiotrichales bacterium 19S3-7]|nr:carboxymuconolactone decarboxylase family protein [Thiotrichales bacterium 19S3-7]MCF6801696.1 carboxymuconolactone decarboxylase family protein [Thiotrichales bacterium 19S3-11]